MFQNIHPALPQATFKWSHIVNKQAFNSTLQVQQYQNQICECEEQKHCNDFYQQGYANGFNSDTVQQQYKRIAICHMFEPKSYFKTMNPKISLSLEADALPMIPKLMTHSPTRT